MGAPVADEAAAVLPPGAERRVALLERLLRRVDLPRVPVESGRHVGDFLFVLRIAAAVLDEHVGDGAERRHLLLRFDEVIPAPLLRADLHDEIRILVVGVEHHVDARDVVRNRLLDVDVLAGGERVRRDPGVREVGRADEHRVDVVAVEHTAIVADDVERLRERAIGALEVRSACSARPRTHRELHVVVARERVEHATGAAAHADDGHPHAVVGALPGEQGLGGCHGQRDRAVLQELSSMHYFSLDPDARVGGEGLYRVTVYDDIWGRAYINSGNRASFACRISGMSDRSDRRAVYRPSVNAT